MKKIFLCMLVFVISLFVLVACNNNEINESGEKNIQNQNDEYTEIDFSDMYEYTPSGEKIVSEKLKNLNNKKVILQGYASNTGASDGSFIYLTNNEYIVSPFFILEEQINIEVVQVLMADESKIEYVADELKVYGTLHVEEVIDLEGNVIQARIYADKIEKIPTSSSKQNIKDYYNDLVAKNTIVVFQILQANMHELSTPEYLTYYGETKRDIVKRVLEDAPLYKKFIDESGEQLSYVDYMNIYLEDLKVYEASDTIIESLNNELIELYEDEILILKRFCEIADKYENKELTDAEIEVAYDEFMALNPDNLEVYNRFNSWLDKLRK